MVLYGNTPSISILSDVKRVSRNKRYGFCFPMGSRLESGFLGRCSGKALIISQIKQLLLTSPGERVMLPNFGIGLRRFAFEPLDEQTYNDISTEVHEAFLNYLPDITLVSLGVFFSDNKIDYSGVPGIIIKLTARPKNVDQLIEVQVNI